jgi:predicted transcriptional regulator
MSRADPFLDKFLSFLWTFFQSGSIRKNVSKVRTQLVEKLVEEFGLSLAETERQLGVSSSAVAKTISRRNTRRISLISQGLSPKSQILSKV